MSNNEPTPKYFVIAINPGRSFPDLVFLGRERILWKHIDGVHVGDIVYMYVSKKDGKNRKEREEHEKIRKERLQKLKAKYGSVSDKSLRYGRIYYKTRVTNIHVKATREELYNPTWIKEEDLDKQVKANDNVELELLKVFDWQKDDLAHELLFSKYGFRKTQKPDNITGKEVLDYIKSVERDNIE